jgi:hypothetical protein
VADNQPAEIRLPNDQGVMRDAPPWPRPVFAAVALLKVSLGSDSEAFLVWGTEPELLALVNEIRQHGQRAVLEPAKPIRPDEVHALLPDWLWED